MPDDDGSELSFIIETGIPIPPPRHPGGSKPLGWRRAFEAMGVGDSFFIKADDFRNGFHGTESAARRAAERAGVKITLRRMEGGLRVWRVQ